MIKLLIADDNRNQLRVLETELTAEGFIVVTADNGTRAVELLGNDEYDVLLLDLNMPNLNGMDVLRRLKAEELSTQVVVLTGNAEVSTAVEAMKLGAYDYLAKPFRMAELKAIIEKAHEKKLLLGENVLLRTRMQRQTPHTGIVTCSPSMLDVLETAKKMALSELPVLIHGESGVGKELVARAIHDFSPRAGAGFVPVNCGAIAGNIMESELFGHEKGAFTGAYSRKMGLLELADKGTVFFDEIGELPLQLQVKLLRVIESRSFFRVGGTREIKVDVKFLFATNKELGRQADEDVFRRDLYYRISGLAILVPPLRERREDIPLLTDYFTKGNPSFRGRKFGDEALRILSSYSWPGNVRELQNVVHRALLLSPNEMIGPDDLPSDLTRQRGAAERRLSEVEKHHILKVLKEAGGRKHRAAEILGIDPKTLYRKLAVYGITAGPEIKT